MLPQLFSLKTNKSPKYYFFSRLHVDGDVVQLVVISGAGQCEAGDDMKGRGSLSTELDQEQKKR